MTGTPLATTPAPTRRFATCGDGVRRTDYPTTRTMKPATMATAGSRRLPLQLHRRRLR